MIGVCLGGGLLTGGGSRSGPGFPRASLGAGEGWTGAGRSGGCDAGSGAGFSEMSDTSEDSPANPFLLDRSVTLASLAAEARVNRPGTASCLVFP